ncbi:MAG TPA: four helix bundle protein [Longimicrobiales bacterium]|nr:four helix bundle protein [Longimicrobiales bacterium]
MRLERMRKVQAAEALAVEVDRRLPRAKAHAPKPADPLERSADPVLFTMAEGAGSFRPKLKIAAYEIAGTAASETRAVLRRLGIRRVFTDREVREAEDLAGACVGMLTAAILALEERADG